VGGKGRTGEQKAKGYNRDRGTGSRSESESEGEVNEGEGEVALGTVGEAASARRQLIGPIIRRPGRQLGFTAFPLPFVSAATLACA
jgi:hypothetical protein